MSGASHASRPYPTSTDQLGYALDDNERRLAGALMRVNHVGEVCAQALYNAQSLSTRDPRLQRQFGQAVWAVPLNQPWPQVVLARRLDADE